MIVYSLLLFTLLFALYSVLLVWRRRSSWPAMLAACAMAGFIYLYGAWIYLSFYAKYVFGATFLLVLLLASLIPAKSKKATGRALTSLRVAATIFFTMLSVLYFTGTNLRPESISLHFPLRHGDYAVLQGGKGLPANLFHSTGRGTVYAIDLVRLDRSGRRCKHIFSSRLEDYFIFGDTIYSPCDGVVKRAVSDNPDNIPPARERGPHNLNGVLIEGDACFVFLGHMKQDAVFVREGQRLKAGTALGLAGNSGFSIEPHLHLQAHAKTKPGLPWYRQPQLFIRFDNQEYLLFERIKTATLPPYIMPE